MLFCWLQSHICYPSNKNAERQKEILRITTESRNDHQSWSNHSQQTLSNTWSNQLAYLFSLLERIFLLDQPSRNGIRCWRLLALIVKASQGARGLLEIYCYQWLGGGRVSFKTNFFHTKNHQKISSVWPSLRKYLSWFLQLLRGWI